MTNSAKVSIASNVIALGALALGWFGPPLQLVFSYPVHNVQLTVWNGLCLASVFGGVRAQPWLVEALAMMILASLFSVTVVLFWQEKLVAAAEAGHWEKTQRALVWWSVCGTASGIPLALVMVLMVSKQALWLG